MRQNHVLVVDDEPIILRSVERSLARRGYEVRAAASGAEALAALSERSFDAVITDIAMSEVSGIEVLRRAKDLDPDVCVIVMTGYNDVSSAVDALRSGAEDYVNKPFDFDEFLLRVDRCVERRELRRKLKFYENVLPVCAACRKIRHDAGREPGTGDWMALEEYAARTAGVKVSHGYCPACAEEFKKK